MPNSVEAVRALGVGGDVSFVCLRKSSNKLSEPRQNSAGVAVLPLFGKVRGKALVVATERI